VDGWEGVGGPERGCLNHTSKTKWQCVLKFIFFYFFISKFFKLIFFAPAAFIMARFIMPLRPPKNKWSIIRI